MKKVELYARVRRAVLVEGMSRRAAAREFGLARKTVSKMLEYSAPPGYQRQKPVRRPTAPRWRPSVAIPLNPQPAHGRTSANTG